MFKKFLPQIVASLFLVGFVVFAWTEPPSAPPAGNVEAPVNVSSASQYKSGALGIGGLLRGYSDAIFDGKIGIGTIAPQGKLDLNGSFAVGGDQGAVGQFLQSQGSGLSPLWSNAQVKVINGSSCPAGYSPASYYYQSRTCSATIKGCGGSTCTTNPAWAPGTMTVVVVGTPGSTWTPYYIPIVSTCVYYEASGGGSCTALACPANVILRTTCVIDNP